MATYEFAAGNSLYYEVVEPRDADGVTFVCFNALSGSIDTWKDTILDTLHALALPNFSSKQLRRRLIKGARVARSRGFWVYMAVRFG